MPEIEFEDVYAELSTAPKSSPLLLSRRSFLKAVTAGVGVAAMPTWMSDAAGAAPLAADQGVLVVVLLGGGNDGLNTVVPTGTGRYYDVRKGLAIGADKALPLSAGVGLHPNLPKLKARYDAGKVAVVQGVGDKSPVLSHFEAMATWMSGWAPGGVPRTGWLGRYLDGIGTDPFTGISIGNSVPLHLQGARTGALSLPATNTNLLFGTRVNEDDSRRALDGLRAFGATSTGLGALPDALARTGRTSVDVDAFLRPCYSPGLTAGALSSQLDLAARLINADLGARVIGVSFGSFDTHAGQGYVHGERLKELDAAIETFFTKLNESVTGRTTLMTFSEFGRRVHPNGSGGTDHGTAGPLFVVGDRVRGGMHGAAPSLTDLDSHGNLKPTVDLHSVYASVLDRWLDADEAAVLGQTVERLDLFTEGPSAAVPLPSVPPAPAVVVPAPAPAPAPVVAAPQPPSVSARAYRIVTTSGEVRSFGGLQTFGHAQGVTTVAGLAQTPDGKGYWVASAKGSVHSFGSAPHHGSASGLQLNAPIVGLAATATGRGYWLLGRDGGIFSYGDAAFFGSTGSMRLNRPVVGMAAVPGGNGYWLVASDGGIFAFGPGVRFHGSTGSMQLNQPIVGMAPTPDGGGYWLVARDGGIFAFGNARFHGSTGSMQLNAPIIDIAATATGNGYRLVAADGGVFCFGDASFEGSAAGAGAAAIA